MENEGDYYTIGVKKIAEGILVIIPLALRPAILLVSSGHTSTHDDLDDLDDDDLIVTR